MTDQARTDATVLVADDDEDFLNLVTLRLEQEGHRVERASDGAEALREAREADPTSASST